MIYVSKELCVTLPDKVLQILPLLPKDQQSLFAQYYQPFTQLPKIDPEIAYHILSLIMESDMLKDHFNSLQINRSR